jgi:hypothetical protein
MMQESRIEEESQITLTGLVGFIRNTTRIGGQIGLLRTVGVTRMDTPVGGQTGLLGIAGVTGTVA